jgi:CubicO group peptidase (beta-lactamase class C family)
MTRNITLYLLIIYLTACSPTITSPPNTSFAPTRTAAVVAMEPRTLLTLDDLISGFSSSSPLDEAALTIPPVSSPPNFIFEGRLELEGEAVNGEVIVFKGSKNQEPEVFHLPEFNFEFVQNVDGYLIPVRRGLIITEHSYWNYILGPGRAWQESDDQGFSRASFPFALVWKGANAILNGTMTFLFNDEQVSNVWYQVTQETTVSLGMDMWGLLEANYFPGQVDDSAEIKEAFSNELADRFPTKHIDELAIDYPGIDLSAFGHSITGKNMTWYGFVINGINYMGGCMTRYGIYPYCESMRAASYSTAKSAFVSLAMMRLAQKYDPGLPDLLIREYVPETNSSPGDWSAVTFNNMLDMASGNYGSAGYMDDEEQWDNPFWTETYYNEVMAAALNWPHGTTPGTQWVYKTTDTFILTRALQNFLESKEGPDADIFDFMVDEIYKPLKMGPGVFSVLRTQDDNWQGQPYGGIGMWWIPDDLAKIGNFLNVDGGKIDGMQILNPEMLAASLQQNPLDRGVKRGGSGMYNNTFWVDPFKAGFNCELWIPTMRGYSGIVVALFPNGSTYYYASDGQEFNYYDALKASDQINPLCK